MNICISQPLTQEEIDILSYTIGACNIKKIFIKNGVINSKQSKLLSQAIIVSSYDAIPNTYTKVLLTPKEARFKQGEISLIDFIHPKNAVYIFGGNNENVEDEIKTKVFVPTDPSYELYNHTVLGMVYYDKLLKDGRSDNR